MSLFLILTLLLSWFTTAQVVKHANKIGLIHLPNHRSSHVRITPHGGGLGVVIGMLPIGLWTLLTQPLGAALYLISLCLGLVIAIKGLLDDIRPLPASIRFVIQLVVCTLLLVGLETLPMPAYNMSTALPTPLLLPLLLIGGVWWINLFNFMDGIDGLAGSQAVFMLLGAAGLVVWQQTALLETTTIQWMLFLAVAIIGFLLHNWAPARVFMGDVGSTFIAFMMLFFALITIRMGWLSYGVWLILGACFIADTTLTLLRRLLNRQRWWEAHRSHAYQRLSRSIQSHHLTTLIVLGVNLAWLLPLAILSVLQPEHSLYWVTFAYLPVVVGIIYLGAGKADHQ